jgi:hypothetical protein
MMEALMGKMDKLSIEMINRHDVPSSKEKEVKRPTRQALSFPDESVAENFNDEEDAVVNHGRKSHTHQNPLYKTWPMREFGGRFWLREEF